MKLSISTTMRENLLGWSYLPFFILILPSLFNSLNGLLPTPMSDAAINLIFFTVNFVIVVGIFHRFLRESLQVFFTKPWKCLGIAALGVLMYYAQLLLISFVITQLVPDFSNINDSHILQMVQNHRVLMCFATVILVPITEELLYRGLVFQSLCQKSRPVAFCISVCIFAWIHVMGYVSLYDWKILLLCFLQYLPAGLTLALAYEQADTVVTPMLIHITINLLGLFAMR